jgi:hypothetical protein
VRRPDRLPCRPVAVAVTLGRLGKVQDPQGGRRSHATPRGLPALSGDFLGRIGGTHVRSRVISGLDMPVVTKATPRFPASPVILEQVVAASQRSRGTRACRSRRALTHRSVAWSQVQASRHVHVAPTRAGLVSSGRRSIP